MNFQFLVKMSIFGKIQLIFSDFLEYLTEKQNQQERSLFLKKRKKAAQRPPRAVSKAP